MRIGEIAVGLTLPPRPCVVSAALQQAYHEPAGVPAGLFAGTVDPSVLANQCLLATRLLREGRPAGLHMGHRMLQYEPIALDEPLTIHGVVAEMEAIAAGTRIRVDLEFRRADDSVPVRAQTTNLRLDAAAMRGRRRREAKGERRCNDCVVALKQLTPEGVMDYSREFPEDKVHFDPEVARSIGFRAPVAQGLMSLTWMTAALAAAGPPRELDIAAEFRRPIFWDDEVEVRTRDERLFRIVNARGQLCSLGRVAHLVRP